MQTRTLKWKRLSPGYYRAFGNQHRYIIQRADNEWFLQVTELFSISDLNSTDKPEVAFHRCGSKRAATDIALEMENTA